MTTRLDEHNVITIRRLRANGATTREIAESYGISLGTVSKICRGILHPDVGGPLTRAGTTYQYAPKPPDRAIEAEIQAMFRGLLANPTIAVPEMVKHWMAAAEQATVGACAAELQQRRTQKEAT